MKFTFAEIACIRPMSAENKNILFVLSFNLPCTVTDSVAPFTGKWTAYCNTMTKCEHRLCLWTWKSTSYCNPSSKCIYGYRCLLLLSADCCCRLQNWLAHGNVRLCCRLSCKGWLKISTLPRCWRVVVNIPKIILHSSMMPNKHRFTYLCEGLHERGGPPSSQTIASIHTPTMQTPAPAMQTPYHADAIPPKPYPPPLKCRPPCG